MTTKDNQFGIAKWPGDEHCHFADTGLLDELGLETLAPTLTKDR